VAIVGKSNNSCISVISVNGDSEASVGPKDWSWIQSIAWVRDGSALMISAWSRSWRLLQILAKNAVLKLCSGDGKWIEHSSLQDQWKEFKVPIDGGPPVPIKDEPRDGIPSPDGHWVAYRIPRNSPVSKSLLGIARAVIPNP
jgi:hypothetical protein